MDPVQNSNNNLRDSPAQTETPKPAFVTQEISSSDQVQTSTTEEPLQSSQIVSYLVS